MSMLSPFPMLLAYFSVIMIIRNHAKNDRVKCLYVKMNPAFLCCPCMFPIQLPNLYYPSVTWDS